MNSRSLPFRFPGPPRTAGTALLWIVLGSVVSAQTWINPDTGDWFSAANWSGNSVPTSDTHPEINTGTVQFSGGSAQTGALGIGTNNTTTSPAFMLSNGGTLANTSSTLGSQAGASGSATVTGEGSRWTMSSSFIIGLYGTGTFTVSDQAQISATYSTLGSYSGAHGALTVTGAGSRWTTTSATTIGEAGEGSVLISGGATATGAEVTLGSSVGGNGIATVTGAGSTWNTGSLTVGYGGTGALTLADGATVANAGGVRIGGYPGGSGSVSLGGGASWTNAGTLNVGFMGSGTLTAAGASTLTSEEGIIGLNTGVTASVHLSGSSQWTNTADVTVGYSGTGSLTIAGGSTVTNYDGVLGLYASGQGTADVSGTGSKWINTSGLYVGYLGSGILRIYDGGTVDVANGTGTVSLGSSSSQIIIGQGGAAGTLNAARVSSKGRITFNHNETAYTFAPKVTGTLALVLEGPGKTTLTGANTYSGGTTVTKGSLVAGNASAFGTGPVRIDAGALDLANLAIGNALDVRGGAVTGLSAYIGTQTLSARVGYSGTVGGTLLVADGGHADTTGTAFTGTTTVQSGGSLGGTGTAAFAGFKNTGGVPLLARLDAGDPIGASGAYITDFATVWYYHASKPAENDWALGDTGYVGIEVFSGEDVLYGWLHITLNMTGTVTLHDFAYDDSGAFILAGATTTAVPEPAAFAALAGLLALGVAACRRRARA